MIEIADPSLLFEEECNARVMLADMGPPDASMTYWLQFLVLICLAESPSEQMYNTLQELFLTKMV